MADPLGDAADDNGSLVARQNAGHKRAIDLGEPALWFRDEITQFVQGDRYLLAAGAGTGKSLFLTQLGIALAPTERSRMS